MATMYLVGAGLLMALMFATFMPVRIRGEPRGNPEMLHISGATQKGANAYLRHQYKGVGIFFAAVFVVLLVMAFCGFLSSFTLFVFLIGGSFSGLSGLADMRTTTMANRRTAQEASRNLNRGLRVVFSTGSIMGFTVMGLGLLDLTTWYLMLSIAFGVPPDNQRVAQITVNMLTFDVDASSIVLSARVGGGVSTKAADVGTDPVGKVEAEIPESDPRNSAVIADSMDDNAGDAAGMDTDLYEPYVGSIVSTAALAVATGYGGKGMIIPMMLAALGALTSILGTFFIETEEGASQKNLLKALRTGTYISAALVVVAAYAAICIPLPDHMGIYVAVLSGLAAGMLIGAVVKYYTPDAYNPTRELVASSRTGGTTIIVSGLSLGMLFTVAPVAIVGVSVLVSYYCSGGNTDFGARLYGVGVSATGTLSTLGITLATDAYGLVAGDTGGVTRMTHMPEGVRQGTGALDSLGNTTVVTGKGFATGSAALTAPALIAPYVDKAKQIDPSLSVDPPITDPTMFISLFTGGVPPFLFAAPTMEAVGEVAQSIVVEVRRQLREVKGLIEEKAEPNYGTCVDMYAVSAQRLIVTLVMVAVIISVTVGLLLGPEGASRLLAGNTVTGFVLAAMMTGVGGAWDSVKKYMGSRQLGGKGNEEHKMAVIGGTVGDPFKNTSDPPISILIKLTSMTSIVLAEPIVVVHLL